MKSLTDLNITFIDAIIKDEAVNIVYDAGSLPFAITPTELPTNSEITLTIDLNATLVSGAYIVTLVTSKGSSFVSPTFTAP